MNIRTAGSGLARKIAPPEAIPDREGPISPTGSAPIRAELFGLEHLQAYARALAQEAETAEVRAGQPLLRRFFDNGRVLERAYRLIAEVYQRREALGADAEWLLDNFHIVESVLREIRNDLPRGYYRQLPKMTAGAFTGFPRVYLLAVELIAHTDSSLDETSLVQFIQAFQSITPLTIGELWAVPTMLRLGLLENLRRLAEQMTRARGDHRLAESCVQQFLAAGSQPSDNRYSTIDSREPKLLFTLPAHLSDACIVRLLELLREHGSTAASCVECLESHLESLGTCAAEVLRREHQRQAANQVSIGNCVTSLRLLEVLDWSAFFERTSLVEAILRDDPSGIYSRQDFATRDRCRQMVEQLAFGSGKHELAVARRALSLARRNFDAMRQDEESRAVGQTRGAMGSSEPPVSEHRTSKVESRMPPKAHVTYFLFDQGVAELKADIGYRPKWSELAREVILAHSRTLYFGGIALLTSLLVTVVTYLGWGMPIVPLLLLVLVAVIPASEVAVGLINSLVTWILPPRVLPKLDFHDGIPSEAITFVVMPCMLLGPQSIEILLERLEIHYLSNPDPNLRFALLTDFADAPAEQMPEDEELVRAALAGIKTLNERHPLVASAKGSIKAGALATDQRATASPNAPGQDRFFLFHRHRRWNPGQGCWMGWERKRGKLQEFNRLLRGARDTSFSIQSADPSALPLIRYVLTLDADTHLPRDTAHRLVATIAHPLNRAYFDPQARRVVDGYAILQPRVSFTLSVATRSLFARAWTGSAGINPYTTAVSDPYQDLFGVGSFIGKGIYDIDAFEAATGRTFPDNHILSHDLIEGNFARCGLVSDIELFDDFPARYHVYARREHRWARGDWQLLPWLFRRVPAPPTTNKGSGQQSGEQRARGEGQTQFRAEREIENRKSKIENPLPLLERWKVFDNLRRSLVSPSLVATLVLGCLMMPAMSWLWLGIVLVTLFLPVILLMLTGAFNGLRSGSPRGHLREMRAELLPTLGQVVYATIFLADQARLMVDAIARTLYRMYVSRRHLLEWETAATTDRRLETSLRAFWCSMWPTSAVTLAAGVLLGVFQPSTLVVAGPLLVLWLISPLFAYWVSRQRISRERPLSQQERQELRRIARKTWGFFETYVGDADHWLPPDNYQEFPKGVVAHRTSPTNMGLLLLSSLAAHDLGYLSLTALLERLEKTLDTLDRLERYHGHFLNWYETTTLKPLPPPYVSTVDSGNLMACLLALKQGLREKIDEPIPGPQFLEGLGDTLGLVKESLSSLEPKVAQVEGASADVFHFVRKSLQELDHLLKQSPDNLRGWYEWLQAMDNRCRDLASQAHRLARLFEGTNEDLEQWTARLTDQIRGQKQELVGLAPWVLFDPNQSRYERLLAVRSAADLQGMLETLLSEPNLDNRLEQAVRASTAGDLLARCQRLADHAAMFATDMDFKIVYNEQRKLFAVGLNLVHGRLDSAYYDLLASEARLASFLAIARGDADRRHWFQLGRPLTRTAGMLALISWGGTMFEYLMPRLLLHGYSGTLLDESCRAAVARQMEYGRQHRVPWGISESSFYALDVALDYQYQSFGVPGLGFKRGLGRDLVIAPYATMLAVSVCPRAALANLRYLAQEGAEGRYGFYEAVDYTRERVPKEARCQVVRSYMAHHQGMGLIALANCLLGEPMVNRFHREPLVRATELLLQERVPRALPIIQPHSDEATAPQPMAVAYRPVSRRIGSAHTPAPRTHLLSNGQYTVMITNAGAGYSSCQGMDVTRWREDRTRDCWGQFCYVRDSHSGLIWSAGHHPVGRTPDTYEVVFSADKAEFHRSDAGIETHLEITVTPENRAEIRRITLTNRNPRPHELELTSYAEIVLGSHNSDLAHPAFGKLFLETQAVPSKDGLLCRRRPRSPEQKPVWAVHVMAVDGPVIGGVQYETDRGRFLGRGRTASRPAALDRGAVLSGTTGPVLDPIFSLRRRVRLDPEGAPVTVAFTTAVADTREEALALIDQYHDIHAVTRAFELAWAHSQVELRHLQHSAEDVHLYQRLAAHVLYAGSALRADAKVLAANRQGQPGLWRHGISGDKPLVLARIAEVEQLPLIQHLIAAHNYWHLKGLQVDLVIINEHATGYFEELHQRLQTLVRTSPAHALADKPGGVFIRKADHLSEEDKVLLQAAARVVLSGDRGSLARQIERQERTAKSPRRFVSASPSQRPSPSPLPENDKLRVKEGAKTRVAPAVGSDLMFANGYGGFTHDGREYIITLNGEERQARGEGQETAGRGRWAADRGQSVLPPAPWINVIANPSCGFLVSESGAGFTWVGNSQLNRLTPWNNDPVSDAPGEIIYLRDEATGETWSATPIPLEVGLADPRRALGFVVRHGQGYTSFECQSHGLFHEVLLFVPPADPVKLICLRVLNSQPRPRQLSATFYAEWVLGTVRDQTMMHVVTEVDPETGAVLARNAFNSDFASHIAFAAANARPDAWTADRTEFLGRNGSPFAPAALGMASLSGRVGPGLDPCAVLQINIELQPGESRDLVFMLGQAPTLDDVRKLIARHQQPGQTEAVLKQVQECWEEVLGAIQVRTPNPAMNLMLNRWLLYQTLSCRVWARSAFYQSGGAYGFRDQLQDVMALVYAAPKIARAHILLAASRQFPEGDVQHWWHPPAGRGVRTRFSDDFLWLPFVVAHYVSTTDDREILDEPVPFIKGPQLKPEQEEDYGLPETSAEVGSLYEHCCRAVEHGLRFGSHRLPLMGTGDWNDGMNRVGAGGQGESVWVGWFLLTILRQFEEVARMRHDVSRATRYHDEAEKLRQAIEETAWDGAWYRRAYFDDGAPLGSAQNEECKIDSLAQTWAVISGAADRRRAEQAMASVWEHLVRRDDKLILLFTPPFDQGQLHPGYIKGYVPGIRENGGQYTHAATWVVQATAMLRQGSRAMELFDLLNPVSHASSQEEAARYRVEPYVVAADIYGQPPHVGRGGWTWYTGSAGWLYRVGLEYILGFQLRGNRLRMDPCIPASWREFEITYRYRSATYHIMVENPAGFEHGVCHVSVDGQPQEASSIELLDDSRQHQVLVKLGLTNRPNRID